MSGRKPKETKTPEEGVRLDLHKTAVLGLITLSTLLFLYDAFYLLPDAYPTALERLKTIALFLLMSYGFGYTFMGFVSKPEDALERFSMTLGMGLGVMPILTHILNTFRIPLDATLFLVLSLVYPAYTLFVKNKGELNLNAFYGILTEKKSLKVLVVLLFASIYLHVLLTGAFSMPYLEDDDSWDHAVGAKYISVVKDYSLPPGVPVTHYLEPYPPAYDGLMGLLHQYNSSLQWTLKFFNALLIGLSIVTAFYFLRLFTSDERVALGGSFLLTVIPCYLSHFIWAHTLGHVLFYPALYAVERSNRDSKWALLAVLAIASVVVSQPMVSLVFGLFYLLYYITRAVFERKMLARLLLTGLFGLLVAVVFFWGQMVVKYGTGFEKIDGAGNFIKSGNFKIAFEKRTIPLEEILLVSPAGGQPAGCATLIPGLYCIPLYGNIALQKGFGVVVFLLFILSIILLLARYRHETKDGGYWIPVSLVWSAFTFIGLESWALPVSVDPPRFLMFMTLPLVVIVPKGVLMLTEMLGKYIKPEHLLLLLAAAVLYTSAYPKYEVQTAIWPYGVMWMNVEHIRGYVNLKQWTPPDARVFPMCMSDSAVIGMDKLSYAWDREVLDFREKILERTPLELHLFLKNKGYEYVLLDVSCINKCMKNGTEEECVSKINGIAGSMVKNGGFVPQNWSTQAVLAYKVV